MALLKVWKWSLGVVVRSPATPLLAALAALWAYGAYQWLGVPESSALMLLLALVWAFVQVVVAAAVAAGTTLDAAEAAGGDGKPMKRIYGLTFNGRLIGQTVLMLLATSPVVLLLSLIFHWVNAHALEVASFLTFHSSKPVSYHMLEKVFWWLEAVAWAAISGFLLSILRMGLRTGWKEALRQIARILVDCCFRTSFLTSLVSAGVFGSLAVLLATWHVNATPGKWDYLQLVVRMSLALLLLAAGWLFWTLSLARLRREWENLPLRSSSATATTAGAEANT